MHKIKAGIIRTRDPYEGVRRLIETIDCQHIRVRDASVLLKPNILSPFPPEENLSNTHPDVVGALVRYLKEEGAKKVLVGDEPVWGIDPGLCYKKSGILEKVTREGGELVFFNEKKRIRKKVPDARIFDTISLPGILEEIDLLINIPKMKTNTLTLVTLCIKNLFGLITFRDRKRFHRGVDLAYALYSSTQQSPCRQTLRSGHS